MASSGVEAEMEHHSENDVGKPKLTSPCMTQQLEDSHDQQLMEKESPNSPSPVKRWEIRPLLQSFKSKMASFTEIVMSPVRLFKPTGSLSSIVLPEQRERFIESNVESSTWTEKEDTVDGKCKSGLLSKRPSSERVQCDPPPKRHRVIQRLDFGTVSSNNHEPVLKQNEMHDGAQVAPKEEDYQLNRPSIQPHAILQDGSQSPYLKLGFIPSSDQPAMQMSCPANMNTNAIVVLQRLSSTYSSDTACGLNSESNAVFEDSTEQKPDSCHSFSDFLSTDEDTNRGGSKEPCLRKSPRKLIRHQSETVVSTSTKLKTFDMSLADEMKELHSINVIEWTHHSAIVSDPPKSTSVADVKSEICRESPTTEIQKDMLSKGKLRKAKEGGLRRAKNKRVIILEETQEDIICVRRKKRKAISTAQKLQSSNMGVITSNTAHVETSEACDSTESKEMGREKTLLTSSNKGDAADTISSQNYLGNVLFDRSLHNINTMNDCNCEISRPSDPPGLQDSMQTHEAKKTKARKTRQHVYKSAGEASLQKRNIRPAKHKFEDYNATSVVDPAGPSAPLKILLLRIDRCCEQSQRTIIEAEEQMTSLCDPEAREKKALMSPKIQSGRERKPNRPTKIANRQTRKHVSVAKRKHIIESKDKAEKMMKDIPVSLSSSSSIRLLRSYSCPEIPSLVFSDFHVSPYHTHENCSTSPIKKSSAVPLPTLHSPSKRTRRHTVCSVEIEREIAPLCLRKEVYPTVRSGPSHPLCPSSLYSPSNSLTALASYFLSSPLAFLSKNSSQGQDHASDSSTDSTHYSVSSLTSSFVPSSSPSLCSSPFASTLTSSNPVNGSSTVVTPSPEISTSVPSLCSTFSQSSLEGDHGITQMECHEVVDEEERSSFGLQLSTAICEEKALSDSEIKTDHKKGQRGKVSSIRICKKIPKPQNNLTPMGLPKVVRIKKKDFSLEEIYTNKNFSKPPDGRLETIFEVPLNRKDGSQAVVGQKKVKRFVEFPELGVARKPKKPLVGGVAGGGAQRKAGGNSGICRTRRGVGASSKVKDCLTLQELDSLLFSKLEELDTWMTLQQVAC